MPYVIAVGNQKGGVAKTTTAATLSAAFAERGCAVLAVDLDPQANLGLAFGLKAATLQQGVADVLLGNLPLESATRPTAWPGLTLLPANPEMHLIERFLPTHPHHEFALRQALAHASMYEVVVIDCPPSLGVLSTVAWAAADLLLIPTQCEFFSAHGLTEVLDLVRDVRARVNPGLNYRFLVTLFDRRNNIHRGILAQLQQAFGIAALQTTIEVDTKLRESQMFGEPITHYAPTSRAAQQYRTLAEELSVYVQKEKAAPAV